MKHILNFNEWLNESTLNENRSSYPSWKEYTEGYISELASLGEDKASVKKMMDEFTKVVEKHFKTKANNIVVDLDQEEFFEGDESKLKTIAEIQGKKYGLDSDTLDYIAIEEDESGDLWMTAYDVQRGEMILICKKK